MGRARLSTDREREFALLSFTPLGEVVLGSEDAIALVEPSEAEWVEIRCESCGRWTREAYPRPSGRPSGFEGAIWLCVGCL